MEDSVNLLLELEREISYIKEELKDKIVYCNCESPIDSALYKYFVNNFKELGLKKLTIMGSVEEDVPRKVTFQLLPGGILETRYSVLVGSGKFTSLESVDLIKEADAVIFVTSFVNFTKKMNIVRKYEKKCLVLEDNIWHHYF